MEATNTVTCYSIEWHNSKNYDSKYFGENYELALSEFNECQSKDSFDRMLLVKITFVSKNPIYNRGYLVNNIMRCYEFDSSIKSEYISEKFICNNNVHPLPSIQDFANYISAFKK